MKKFNGKLYTVAHSSNIDKVGWEYDHETNQGVLRVIFKSQKVYDYFPVPKAKWNEYWNTSEKKSTWIRTEIINSPIIGYEQVTN